MAWVLGRDYKHCQYEKEKKISEDSGGPGGIVAEVAFGMGSCSWYTWIPNAQFRTCKKWHPHPPAVWCCRLWVTWIVCYTQVDSEHTHMHTPCHTFSVPASVFLHLLSIFLLQERPVPRAVRDSLFLPSICLFILPTTPPPICLPWAFLISQSPFSFSYTPLLPLLSFFSLFWFFVSF